MAKKNLEDLGNKDKMEEGKKGSELGNTNNGNLPNTMDESGNEDDESTRIAEDVLEHQEPYLQYDIDEEPIPQIQEMSRRVKKIVKVIDILEFVDSCLIVGERFLKDDEEARKLIEEIREKILDTETLFTDYLVTGKITKVV